MANPKPFFFALVFSAAFQACGQNIPEDAPTNSQDTGTQLILDSLILAFRSETGFQGTVLVAKAGQVAFVKGYGMANLEWDIPNVPETKFAIASVSKQFTALLVLQLAAQGLIRLEAPILDYLPGYRQETGRQVTVHDLLTHRSGIPNYTALPGVWTDSLRNHYSLTQLIEKFCSGLPEFKPGSNYSYNNSGYVLLAQILENVTGKTYADLLTERILAPLGMFGAGVDVREKVMPKRASGYVKEGQDLMNANYTYMANLIGAGNMYATVHDLFLWDQALYTGKMLPPQVLELMMTPYSTGTSWIAPLKNGYGYGMGLANTKGGTPDEGIDMVFHSGHVAGFSAFFARFTEQRHTVVLLSNLGNIDTKRMNALSLGIKDVLDGRPLGKNVGK